MQLPVSNSPCSPRDAHCMRRLPPMAVTVACLVSEVSV